jgi:perosamine synthetase
MIRLASPDIRESDIIRVRQVLESGNLVQGQFVETFEKKLSEFSKVENCAVVSSGTAALHLSLLALGIKAGDWVIVPAFTFPATANVVEMIGANVLLCDVDANQYVVQARDIEKVILENPDKEIRAIIVVHEFGFPAQIKEISKVAKKYNLLLVEDSACALGTLADEHHTGHYSDLACFSFHPRKAITTGEGGAVLSMNPILIDKIKSLRNHGMSYTQGGIDFIYAGLNYRLTEIQAALGLGQLERFDNELKTRKILAMVYYEKLKSQKLIQLPVFHNNHSWQSFMIVLSEEINRSELIQRLSKNGIQTNLGAQALHVLSYYKNKYQLDRDDYRNSLRLYSSGLVLPIYAKLIKDDIVFIADAVLKLLQG